VHWRGGHLNSLLQSVAHAQAARRICKTCGESLDQRLVHNEAARRSTDLSGIDEFSRRTGFSSAHRVGILADDHRSMAPELHDRRFMTAAASPARCLPTGIEPVKAIKRISFAATRYEDTSDGTPKTRLSTPAGTPASAKQRTNSTAVPGTSSEALMIIEQPALNAAAIFLVGEPAGKFQV